MFHKTNLFSQDLRSVVAHDGLGRVLTKRVLTTDLCDGDCNFIDYTVMPVGTTIGLHSHNANEEEYYLIIDGEGRMTTNGKEFAIKAGDLIRNPPSGSHSLRNTGKTPIKLFVFELRVQ